MGSQFRRKGLFRLRLISWNPCCCEYLTVFVISFEGYPSVFQLSIFLQCHLSLVGQWIEEAKSKLTDPGLVYAYHGGNRKRDPMILAQNSIVVTTYATLSSDKFYKGYHGGRDDYVPPCEQVRWWRIICDESHTLKTCSKQRQTVFNLVGDHKWAVSGT